VHSTLRPFPSLRGGKGAFLFLVVSIFLASFATPAQARELFLADFCISPPTAVMGSMLLTDRVRSCTGESRTTLTFDNIENFVDTFDLDEFEKVVMTYSVDPTVAVGAILDIRGLTATAELLSDTSSNPHRLIFRVASLDIEQMFDPVNMDSILRDMREGGTEHRRRDVLNQFEDYLKNNGENVLTRVLQQLVATTPIDPVAGNPNSLMNQMAMSSFDVATDLASDWSVVESMMDLETAWRRKTILEGGGYLRAAYQVAQDTRQAAQSRRSGAARSAIPNSVLTGARFGTYSVGDYVQTVWSLPFAYSVEFDNHPAHRLVFDFPLTYIDTDGGASYNLQIGIGYQFPLTRSGAWSLTPMLRGGAVGSIDLGAAAILYGGGLTSNVRWNIGRVKFSIGNSLQRFQSQKIDAGDYEIDYDLVNYVTRNGINLKIPVSRKLSWDFSVAHTKLYGDEVFVDSYMDFATSFGFKVLRIGITYTYGFGDYEGAKANLGYRF